MNREEINNLLEKYLSGDISPEEKEMLDAWYSEFESHENVTDRMREEEQWEIRNRILGGIRKEAFQDLSKGASKSFRNKRPFMGYVTWAASLILIAVTGYVMYSWQAQPVVYQTDFGEVLILQLPDSTKVTLNGNTVLSYQPNWLGMFDRKVTLNGEAFFDVTHTIDNRRFTINEDMGMGLEVYGTEFNYSARKGINAVALKSGSVKVMLPEETRDPKKAHFLKPGELATYTVQHKEVEIESPKNLESYYAWKEGKLILDYSTLPEIIEKIKGTYGLSISMDTSNWISHKVSGTLPLMRDPESLIKNLEQLFDVEIEITEQK